MQFSQHLNNNQAQGRDQGEEPSYVNEISGIIGTSPKTKQKYQQLAQQLQVRVEEIEHPPFEIVDNTDDVEPKPANIIIKNEVTTIHNQIFIQSPNQTIDTNKMPPLIKGTFQQTPSAQTQMQQPQFSGQTAKSKASSNLLPKPTLHGNPQLQQQNFTMQNKDPNSLTHSTINPNAPNSFLPRIEGQVQNPHSYLSSGLGSGPPQQQNLQNGYISDYYKQNKQINIKRALREGTAGAKNNQSDKSSSIQYISDQSERRSNKGYKSNTNGQQQEQMQSHQQQNNHAGQQKIVDKKFFRSKIDFMAPIKSLQNRQSNSNIDPTLSDDSYYNPPSAMGGQIQARNFQPRESNPLSAARQNQP